MRKITLNLTIFRFLVPAFLLIAAALPAKTVSLTVAPGDSDAQIADLRPLFGLAWKLILTPQHIKNSAYSVQFVDDHTGFLSVFCSQWTPLSQLWRYDRGRWQRMEPGAFEGHMLQSLFALNSRNIWLALQDGKSPKQELLHFDGQSWKKVATPNSDRIRSLFMLSPTDGWAGCEWGQLMHYDGRSWRLAPCPTPAHILSLLMFDDSTGFAATKSHRRSNFILKYNGQGWSAAAGDGGEWLSLLTGSETILPRPRMWPAEFQERIVWLQRPAAVRDTLFLQVPILPNQLLLTHRSGTLLNGRLARSFKEPGNDWIANLLEEPQNDSTHTWITFHFYTREGDKRILVIRLPLQKEAPTLFDNNYLTGSSYFVAEHGMAVADFNGDGFEDLFAVATGAANHLFLTPPPGSRQPQFEIAAKAGVAGDGNLATGIANYDEGASAADVDNDGDQDILVTSLYGPNLLYRQIRRGRFREELGFAGLDNCLTRTCSAIWADVDNDGSLDLYISSEDSTNRLYLNNGAGIFRDVTDAAGLRIDRGGGGSAFADVDGDGDPDLFVPRYGQANLLYINDGAANSDHMPRFREAGLTAGVAGSDTLARSTSATFGDVDNDGDLDLMVTNMFHSNWLYLNDGHGRFSDVTSTHGVASNDLSQTALFLEADNDGDLDLLIGNRGLNRYYENQGDGRFVEKTNKAGIYLPAISTGMACFDQEEDGDLDVYLGQGEGRSSLYHNNADNDSWLQVRVHGDRSNRDAVGARLTLYENGHLGESDHLLGMREVSGGSGYNSMSSRIAHFGVPDVEKLALEVRFPGGTIRRISPITAGQRIEVFESGGWQRRAALLRKWALRVRSNPDPRLPIALQMIFMMLVLAFAWRQIHYKEWPGYILWLMVALPGFVLLLLLILLAGQPAWMRYSLALGLALTAWCLAYGIYESRDGRMNHSEEDLEKLFLTTSAFFHGEWGARKLNRIEFFCQNLRGGQELPEEVLAAFLQAIDEYYTMIMPELEKIIQLCAGGKTPIHLRHALRTSMFNLSQSLGELKIDLKLGGAKTVETALRRCEVLQIELRTLHKEVSSRFSCQVDQVVEETLQQYKGGLVEVTLNRRTLSKLWARFPAYALSQILENLLDNASAAVANSTVKRVEAELDANADYIFLRVTDSGPGVPEAIRSKLFHEQVSTRHKPGGFGLYHASNILSKFAGAIHLMDDRREGSGAGFEIILKRTEYESPFAAAVD